MRWLPYIERSGFYSSGVVRLGHSSSAAAEDSAVRLDGVSVRYGRMVVLDNVSFSVKPGECVSVSGVNGAGKTTLLRVLAGVFRPNSGRRTRPGGCAYVPAVVEHTPISAGRWLAGMPRPGRTDPNVVLDAMGFDGDLGAPCRALSFGNARKLLLAEAVSSGERFVVIDELSSGLDQRGLDGLHGLIHDMRNDGCAFVLADQQTRPVPNVDAAYTIMGGKLRTAGSDQRSTIRLSGPTVSLDTLINAANELGFGVDQDTT